MIINGKSPEQMLAIAALRMIVRGTRRERHEFMARHMIEPSKKIGANNRKLAEFALNMLEPAS